MPAQIKTLSDPERPYFHETGVCPQFCTAELVAAMRSQYPDAAFVKGLETSAKVMEGEIK
ncbi:hypothetical protein [Massilia glaciei]|uniref:hypothetical protein n=1 Tax=Massilia glaciei TaxID=1524097 RepID=UPI0011B23FE8|nr:hypothetical protein [Massilia glaciei]